MAINIRKSSDRGQFDFNWLQTSHTFSFGDYYDPRFMGFRSLRVINEDFIQAGKGFPTHSHRDMEIVSYVVSGALAHKDSMGNGSTILPGDVQFMSAGSGVSHSEYNHSTEGSTHLLQIWILPKHQGSKPRYDQKQFSREEKLNQLCRVVSGSENGKAIVIDQDADIFASILESGKKLEHPVAKGRAVYLQLIKGELELSTQKLSAGDGVFILDEEKISLQAKTESEFLIFDLS